MSLRGGDGRGGEGEGGKEGEGRRGEEGRGGWGGEGRGDIERKKLDTLHRKLTERQSRMKK